MAMTTPHQVVEVLLPRPFDHGFDYDVPEGMALQPGDYVQVPLGKSTAVGVVWHIDVDPTRTKSRKSVLAKLDAAPPMPHAMREFLHWVADYTLAPLGMIMKMAVPVPKAFTTQSRNKAEPEAKSPQPPTLSATQQEAAQQLAGTLGKGYSVTLLDGVTGSGKTEIYLHAVEQALRSGGQVLVLIPEIALSVQWLEKCRTRLGVEPVVWHSNIPEAARKRNWRRIANGEAKLVVGARSALFLPFPDLSLIVVDEEHEQSYKQEEGVLYHARDMAVARAKIESIPAVLVSATPSLETLLNAERGRYQTIRLTERFHAQAALPEVKLLDLRLEKMPATQYLSHALKEAVTQTLAQGEQALLFLNRRGYAPLLLCRACGHRFECPHCTSWMVLHQRANRLQCHHCDHREPAPTACPSCKTEGNLHPCGPGVERIAEEVRGLWPEARLAVLSSDEGQASQLAELILKMERHEVDLVIGTQLVAKGHHFPNLATVGVVDADLSLNGGDLRASERTFQLLTQLGGRAGRENTAGTVYLQTYQPDHPVMQALASNDRDRFMALEAKQRHMAGAPPFTRFAALLLDGVNEVEVAQHARLLVRAAPVHPDIRILGPTPAPLSRLKGRYRYRLLVKSPRELPLQPYLRQWLSAVPETRRVRIKADIDPYSFV